MAGSGGGWGDPLEREPVRVRNDVARQLVTREKAVEEYGVVLLGDTLDIDLRATEERRSHLRGSRAPLETFDFGERPDPAAVA